MCDQLHNSLTRTHSLLKFFIFTTILLLFTVESAQACSCKHSKTIKEEIDRSTLVFKGTPVSADTIGVRMRWNKNDTVNYIQIRFKFVVEKYYKGGYKSDTVNVITGLGNGDCGFPFKIGEDYLIYANTQTIEEYDLNLLSQSKENKTSALKFTSSIYYETNMCTWTHLYRKGSELILENELKKPKQGS